MKKNYVFVICILSVFLFSCENSIQPDYDETTSLSRSVRVTRGKSSGAIDPLPFIDVTMKNVNANDIVLKDFESLANGTYVSKEGNRIRVDKKAHKVFINVINTKINDEKYSNIFISFEYKLNAASDNLVYLCPLTQKLCEVSSNGHKIEIDKFGPYISMYGFGEGRIEVSDHLKNVSLIPSGTYWRK